MSTEYSINVNDIIDRLKDYQGVDSDAEFGRTIDMKPSTLSMARKRNSIDLSYIFTKFESLNKNWIVDGEGPVWKKDLQEFTKAAHVRRSISGSLPDSSIPFYRSVRPAAGGGIVPEDETDLIYIGLPRSFIYERLRTTPAELFILRVEGDSMAPTIGHEDFVIVKRNATRPLIGIFLIRLGDTIFCKRLDERPAAIRVISDNPAYEDYDFPRSDDEMEVLGRVVWCGKALV